MESAAVPIIVLPEAPELSKLMDVLAAAEKRVSEGSYQTREMDEARSLARLAEALESAGDAVFNALSTAHAYSRCSVATRAIADRQRRSLGLPEGS